MDGDEHRRLECDQRREILHRIVFDLGHARNDGVEAIRRNQERVAIGFGTEIIVRRDRAASTGPIVVDDALSGRLRELFTKNAGDVVAHSTRRVTDHASDIPTRILLAEADIGNASGHNHSGSPRQDRAAGKRDGHDGTSHCFSTRLQEDMISSRIDGCGSSQQSDGDRRRRPS